MPRRFSKISPKFKNYIYIPEEMRIQEEREREERTREMRIQREIRRRANEFDIIAEAAYNLIIVHLRRKLEPLGLMDIANFYIEHVIRELSRYCFNYATNRLRGFPYTHQVQLTDGVEELLFNEILSDNNISNLIENFVRPLGR